LQALTGDALPGDWTAERSVLVGTGREPVPDDYADLRARLPAFS
jgi:hypothetical protein